MASLLERLSPQVREELRARHPPESDESWVFRVAEASGWREANERYLANQRERGRAEMAALMAALAIPRVDSADLAAELIEAAYQLYMPPERYQGSVERVGQRVLNIRIVRCPTFQKIEEGSWHGVTACGSWHRRQGWYEAMGIQARDSLISEQKWGEEACAAQVELLAS